MNLPELAAIAGSLFFLASFAYINRGIGARADIPYLLMNMLGALLMLYSLSEYWNIGVLINNAAWVVISAYGFIKTYRMRGKAAPATERT